MEARSRRIDREAESSARPEREEEARAEGCASGCGKPRRRSHERVNLGDRPVLPTPNARQPAHPSAS
jgi:hypothetical protein